MSTHGAESALVVAHPDDEALWLSSVVKSAQRVVFAFGDVAGRPQLSAARRRAVATLPLHGIVNLAIPESGVPWQDYQSHPEPAPAGIRIADAALQARYERNYNTLLAGLRECLAGCRDVYTHNPWGEYGHPEHIQVHRAVSDLRDELGFTVWFSNYVSAKNWGFVTELAAQLGWARRLQVQTDAATARALMRLYRDCGAWTWKSDHRWPGREVLYAQPPAGAPESRQSFCGEWLLDVGRLRWWNPPWRSPSRQLPATR